MKILVAGSRSINPQTIIFTFTNLLNTFSISEFVTGCAKGPDRLPWEYNYAFSLNVPIKEFPADWNKYGKRAGPIRNAEMAEYCDAAIILWDGKSKGTKNMIDNMNRVNKPYILFRI